MKKFFKTTAMALAVLTSACALASCGGNEDKTTIPSTIVPTTSPKPSVDPTEKPKPDKTPEPTPSTTAPTETKPVAPEVDKTIFSFDSSLIDLNIGKDEVMPEAGSYDIYAKYNNGEGYIFIKAEDDKVKLTGNIADLKLVLIKKGSEANNNNILASVSDIIIAGQNLVFNVINRPAEAVFEEYNFDAKRLPYNLKNPTKLPDEYDIYTYYWYAEGLSAWVKCQDGKALLDNRIDGALLAIVKKDSIPSWSEDGIKNIIAQTENLAINDHELVLDIDVPKEIKISVNLELLEYNLAKDNKMPEVEYDLYAYLYTDGLADKFVKLDGNKFMANEGYKHAVIAFIKKGMEPSFDTDAFLAKTLDGIIEGSQVIFNNDKPKPVNPSVKYTFDRSLLAYNLKNGKTLPEGYSLYIRAWGEDLEAYDTLVEGDSVILDKRASNAYFIIVKEGLKPTLDYNKGCLGISTELTFGGMNKLLFNITEDPFVDNISFTFNKDDIRFNLKDNKPMPKEYDLYLYWWVTDSINGFYHVTANTASLSSSITGASFVLIKKGMAASFDNMLAQTTDATISEDHRILLANRSPELHEVMVDRNLIKFNLAKGSYVPMDNEYDLYAHVYLDKSKFIDIKLEADSFMAPENYNNVTFLYVKKGMDPSFDGDSFLAKSIDLSIKDKKVVFVTNKLELKSYSFNLDTLRWNLVDDKGMPNEYDLYIRFWGNDNYEGYIKPVNNMVTLDSRCNGAQFVLIKKGMRPSIDYNGSCYAISTNLEFKDNSLILVNKAPNKVIIDIDLAAIEYNLDKGVNMPEANTYDMYAHVYDKNIFDDIKIISPKLEIYSNYKNIVIYFVKKGEKPSFDGENYLGKTIDLSIADNKVIFPTPAPKYMDITIDLSLVEFNLKEGSSMPSEYDTYLYYWGPSFNGKWLNITDGLNIIDGKIKLDDRANRLFVVLMKKGMPESWDNILAQTTELTINETHEVEFTNGKPLAKDFSYTLDEIAYNLKNGKEMPKDNYEIYLHHWGLAYDTFTILGSEGSITLDERLTGAQFVIVAKGFIPTKDNSKEWLCETTNALIDGNIIKLTNKAPKKVTITVDPTLYQYNLKKGSIPADGAYDIWAHCYIDDNQFIDVKLTKDATSFEALDIYPMVCFVFTKENLEAIDWNDIYCETNGFSIASGTVEFTNAAPVLMDLSYEYNLIQYNLMDANNMPKDNYEIYIYYKVEGYPEVWLRIDNKNTAKVDNKLTKINFVVVKKESTPSWSNGSVLAQTPDLLIEKNAVVFDYDIPLEKEYSFTKEDVLFNLKDGKEISDAVAYDLYIHHWGRAYNSYILVNDINTVTLDNRLTHAEFVLVKKGIDPTTDYNNGCLAITTELIINEASLDLANKAPVYKDINIDIDLYKYNLKNGKFPTDKYTIWAHFYQSTEVFKDIELKPDQKVIRIDEKYNNVVFAFVHENSGLVWGGDNFYCQTIELEIIGNDVVFVNQKPVLATVSYDNTLVEYNLALDNKMPEVEFDYYIYYQVKGYPEVFTLANLATAEIDKNATALKFVMVAKGEIPSFESNNILASSMELKVVDGNVIFKYQKPTEKTFTFNTADIPYNIKDSKVMPEADYDIYLRYWGYNYGGYVLANEATKVVLDSRLDGAQFVVVRKSATPTTDYENGCLALTTDLIINEGSFELTNKAPKAVTVAFDSSLLEYNLKNGVNMPKEEYDLYAHVYQNEKVFDNILVTANSFKTFDNYTSVVFVLVRKDLGHIAWEGEDGYICQSLDLAIKNNEVKFVNQKPVDKVYNVDIKDIPYNLANNASMPSDIHDTYLHVWGAGIDSFIKIDGPTVTLDNRVTGGQYVLVNPGFIPTTTNYDSWLAATINVMFKDNNVVLTHHEVEYTIDVEKALLNIKDNKEISGAHDIYAHIYVDDNDKTDIKITGNSFKTSSHYNHIIFVFVTTGSDMCWGGNGFKGQTVDLSISNGEIIYPVISKNEIEIKADSSLYQYNISKGTMPQGDYEVYAHLFGNGQPDKDVLITNSTFIASGLYKDVVLVFVKPGTGNVVWDGDSNFLAQSSNLSIVAGVVQLKNK